MAFPGLSQAYLAPLAAAFVRGHLLRPEGPYGGSVGRSAALLRKPLQELTEEDMDELLEVGIKAEFPLFPFKRSRILPRVHWAMSVLHGLQPSCLLDIGSGRGTSLWPIVEAFPAVAITALEADEETYFRLKAVQEGGVTNLAVHHGDAMTLPFADASFGGVTFLEVLEHLPDPALALREAARVSRDFVLLTVPSEPDENPEHVHLFDPNRLEKLFAEAGLPRVKIGGVPGHTTVLGRKALAT